MTVTPLILKVRSFQPCGFHTFGAPFGKPDAFWEMDVTVEVKTELAELI